MRVLATLTDAETGRPIAEAAVFSLPHEAADVDIASLGDTVDLLIDLKEGRYGGALEAPFGAVTNPVGQIDFVTEVIWYCSGNERPPPLPSGEEGVLVVQGDGYAPVAVPWKSGRWSHHPSGDWKEPDATVRLGTIALRRTR